MDAQSLVLDEDGDEIGFPALRILLLCNGKVFAQPNQDAIEIFFSAFWAEFGTELQSYSTNIKQFSTQKLKLLNKEIYEGLVRQYVFDENSDSGFRVYGSTLTSIEKKYSKIGIPAVEVQTREYLDDEGANLKRCFSIELAVPIDDPRINDLVSAVEDLISKVDIASGAIGNGIYIPHAFSSVAHYVTPYLNRYSVALVQRFDDAFKGLKKGPFLHKWHPNTKPGCIGIGWKTIIGAEYFDRIAIAEILHNPKQGLNARLSGNNLIVTAGEWPIWGDVNYSEDIREYKNVATALGSIRFPKELVPNIGDEYYADGEFAYYAKLFGDG